MIARKLRLHPLSADVLRKASDFLSLYFTETGDPEGLASRLAEVEMEVGDTGTYRHTAEELEHGARVAWRNSTRCVGRLYWRCLEVLDWRDVTTFEQVCDRLVAYLHWATNGGQIRPSIAIFPAKLPNRQEPRIWNEQLIRYAAYRQPDGSILGDPRQLEITEVIRSLGWEPATRTAFDVLPVVIEMPGESPRLFELPQEEVLEVPFEHPDLPWFADLGLKWHAVPSISNMRLEIGGIDYTMAPFNGWYMGAEVGARNLADEDRYNLLPVMAERLGLDVRRERSLWRDRALVELNVAVLHSYEKAGVKMVDHHTVSEHFLKFEEKEAQAGRPTYADWTWVVPPLSGSTSPLYHHRFVDQEATPNFFYQSAPWRTDGSLPMPKKCPFHKLLNLG